MWLINRNFYQTVYIIHRRLSFINTVQTASIITNKSAHKIVFLSRCLFVSPPARPSVRPPFSLYKSTCNLGSDSLNALQCTDHAAAITVLHHYSPMARTKRFWCCHLLTCRPIKCSLSDCARASSRSMSAIFSRLYSPLLRL